GHAVPRPLVRRGDDVTALVHAAAAGDERAWSHLVVHFSAPIRAVARRHRLSDADQEDVVQRTWLRLVERIGTLREPAALAGWLVTTARREALRVVESSAQELPGGDLVEPADVLAADVHDAVAADERATALRRAIDDLPGRQRALMRLLVAQPPLSYEQVSERLGMPVGSIGPTRGRCLSRLRRDPHLHGVLKEER
ncbi:MAG TPA: sigma-70 family RNA polymerase sigma factor, partial [Solirubrobacteraceae bacterium]|nr:sigma-70 family RNA polymerase sigma factor [Solirubrobacteraceae bacterium]